MSIRATIVGGITAAITMMAMAGGPGSVAAHADSGNAPHEQVLLSAHNAERAEFGSAPLRWNPQLAREAREWAEKLAQEGVMRHSSIQERSGTGENLWMGTAGYFSAAQMIGFLTDEKRHFAAGEFPRVSRTGNWTDVGHYTQIVWAQTREVGCAVSTRHRYDVLVCRYWPAGNVIGTRIAPLRQLAQR